RAPSLNAVQLERLRTLADPVPRREPLAASGNPAEYRVFGRTYRTRRSADGYQATGVASWYGSKFHGRLTSSGEPYDMYALTAAHRELPLPTYLEVTNLVNGRHTVVRVNDRGPFHADRILDLSYAAAVKLGFETTGTARVRVRALPAAIDPKPAPLPLPSVERYYVQVGAFSGEPGAWSLRQRIADLLPAAAPVEVAASAGWYRVRVGPLPTPEAAEIVKWDLARADIRGALVLAEGLAESPIPCQGVC
ncbi:MAG: septal ring lytic transglycosylase RlpA family protein, partial [Pseudomonadota bacterium]